MVFTIRFQPKRRNSTSPSMVGRQFPATQTDVASRVTTSAIGLFSVGFSYDLFQLARLFVIVSWRNFLNSKNLFTEAESQLKTLIRLYIKFWKITRWSPSTCKFCEKFLFKICFFLPPPLSKYLRWSNSGSIAFWKFFIIIRIRL